MEVTSVQQLCQILISSAVGRCTKSQNLTRISILLKSISPLLQISVSDTGAGSCLKEFRCLKYVPDSGSSETWDGVIYITTTSIADNEIDRYQLNLKEAVSGRIMTKLASSSKNGVKFSGTEVSFSVFGCVDEFLPNVTKFLEKMLILKIHNIAIDLVVEDGEKADSKSENLVPMDDLMEASAATTSIERLQLGLENYVFKHGKNTNDICHSCFPSSYHTLTSSITQLHPEKPQHLKVGSGVAYKTENRSAAQIIEVVIIISERLQATTPSCSRACEEKTEVLYFKDFSPCPISGSSLNGLTSIDWKTYGLTLRSVADHDSRVLLEWDNLPSNAHIDIALHHYHKQVVMPSTMGNNNADRNLIRKAVKLALNDLKEKYSGALLSAHAVKICSYAPDLAKTIAGLILSSNDSNFQTECLSLLQLPLKGIEGKTVEDNIERKISAAIEMNDRRPQRNREPAPFLFEDGQFEEPDILDILDEENEDDDIYSSLDI